MTEDEDEMPWLFEVFDKTPAELGRPSHDPRLRKADLVLAVQTEKAINKSNETV